MTEGLKRTALYEEHRALGARMAPCAGYEMPLWYTGVVEEHEAVRAGVGVFDQCHRAEFRVFGFGAFDLLQRLTTNDLSKIAQLGDAQYTLLVDEDGGIIDDPIIYHSGDLEYLLIVNPANRSTDLDWIRSAAGDDFTVVDQTDTERHADRRVVEVVDESDRTALVAVQGPAALDVVAELAGPGFEPPARFSIREAVIDSVPALVSRTGHSGEDGVEILTHVSMAPALWRALLSFPEVTPCGLGAFDTLRLEMGAPLYGPDMDRGVDPISAGLEWAVSAEKGAYIGRESLARLIERGPARRLVGLQLEHGIPRPGYRVLRDGIEVGKVASGTFSPTLRAGIALAYVPTEYATVDTPLEVSVRGRIERARVVRTPFVEMTSLTADEA